MKDYVLRDYQEVAVKSILQAVGQGKKRIFLDMPYGTGKTFVLTALYI